VSLFEIPDIYFSHPDEYPLSTHIKNIAASFNDPTHKRAAAFHDLGKLNKKFQQNINNGGALPFHSLEGALFFLFYNDLGIDIDLFGIFLSILKHHGNLPDVNPLAEDMLADEDYIFRNHPDLTDTVRQIQTIIETKLDFDLEKFCEIFDTESFVNDNNLSGLYSFFRIREIFSKLIFADKYEAIFKEEFRDAPSFETNKYNEKLIAHIDNRKNVLSSVRNAARFDVIEKFKQNNEKKIFFLEAPTGIGKTFTALQLALEIAGGKNKKRIINALPMTSIIDQTYEEYSKVIDSNILLKFHHLTNTKEYIVPGREEENEKNFFRQKNDFISSSWGLDQVIVTTFNQIFNAFYSNRNRDLIKFWTLRDSVIIFDEIQAVPRILLKDFSETISFLSSEFNIDFILMSATIPAIKKFFKPKTTCDLLDLKYYSMAFNNRYSLNFIEKIDTAGKLTEQILKNSKKNNSLVCVVNTKKLALEIYKKIEEIYKADEIFLLSTLFIPQNRKNIITTISNRLKNKQKTILISTQVIEAGVDLDFDCGFREFAPLYSIIQTAGRINRENRDEVRDRAELIITNKIGASPYQPADLLYDEVKELLKTEIRENRILPFLKKYFEISIKQTKQESVLVDHMEQLDFEKTAQQFDSNFMRTLPNIMPVFIEIEDGLYENIRSKRKKIIEELKIPNMPLENKMELKSILKHMAKNISKYVINICNDEAKAFPNFENYGEMKICNYSYIKSGLYSDKKGWTGFSSTLLF
jgi:CRISPR-associated endonuclease/helicase Cas3